jgi:tetratricopeptide (TPR) repeat protein
MITKKSIRYSGVLVIGIFFTLVTVKFVIDTKYRSKLPHYPDAQSISNPLQEQISHAGRKAYLNPSINNLGELGMVYHSGGYAEKAADCYQLAVNKTSKQGKREWIWNYYLGCLKLAQGESKAAIGNFAKVLEMNPGNYQALYYTGEAYQNLGMISEAENIFKRVASTRNLNVNIKNSSQENYIPLQTHAMFRLGRLYLNTNQLDSARMVFNEIIKRKWTFGPAYRFLGEVYTKQGNQGLGKKYNTRSFDLPEYNPPSDSLLDKITILSRSDKILLKQIDEAKRGYNFDWAYKLCNHALEYFPENKFILSSMIEVDCINGNIKEAGNLLDRHLTLFGDDFDELIKTADLLYSKGLQSQSLLYFEKAKKLNPESSR